MSVRDYLGMQAQGWPSNLLALAVTIPINAAVTDMIPMQGKALVGLKMPAAWTAAAIQYYSSLSPNAGEAVPVKDATTANLMQTLVAADDWIAFPLPDAIYTPWLRLKSVTAGSVTGVNQGAEREIILLLRNFLD